MGLRKSFPTGFGESPANRDFMMVAAGIEPAQDFAQLSGASACRSPHPPSAVSTSGSASEVAG
jgi:hypothetical protein